jgi:hypothetical protein
MLWLSIALEIRENYGGLWSVCPYTRSYLFYLSVTTSLREWFLRGRICGVASSRRSSRRGSASVRKNEETGFHAFSFWHLPFKGSIPLKEESRCWMSILVSRSWPSSGSPSAVPCHQEACHRNVNQKTKTTTASNRRYGLDQTPEKTMQHST